MSLPGLRRREQPLYPSPETTSPPTAPTRGVLNELARGFLRGLRDEDSQFAARFASQFVCEQAGHSGGEAGRLRPRTVRGPLPRASPEGRSLEPPD